MSSGGKHAGQEGDVENREQHRLFSLQLLPATETTWYCSVEGCPSSDYGAMIMLVYLHYYGMSFGL